MHILGIVSNQNIAICVLLLAFSIYWADIFGQSNYTNQFLIQSVVDKGISSSDISALFQDKEGYIWVGNNPGLSRFNGDRFENFTHIGDQTIGPIYSIVQDNNGVIWVGGLNGLFYFSAKSFYKVNIEIGVIRSLLIHTNGDMWIAGLGFIPFSWSSADLADIKNDKEIDIKPIVQASEWKKEIGPMRTWTIDEDNKGYVWFGLDNQIVKYDGKKLKTIWRDESQVFKFKMLEVFDEDSLYFGSEASGLLYQHADGFHIHNNSVTYMSDVKDTAVYFLSAEMLFSHQNGQWDTLHILEEYANIYPQQMLLDREGNFWIGTEGDLLRFTRKNIQTLTYPKNPLLGSSFSLIENLTGGVIIGGHGGKTVQIENGHIKVGYTIDIAHNSLIYDMYYLNDTSKLYATSMNGIVVKQNGIETNYTTANGLGDNGQLFFFKSSIGQLWSGGDGGINKISNNQNGGLAFQFYDAQYLEEDIPEFRNIFESPDQTIWAIGDKGLFKIKDSLLKRWKLGDGMSPYPILTEAIVDKDNELWLCTQSNGIYQCSFEKDGHLKLIKNWTTDDGLISNTVLGAHLDTLNRIWIGNAGGICRLSKNDKTVSYCLKEDDGWVFSKSPFLKFVEAKTGQLYVLSKTSFSKISIYEEIKNKVKPNVVIDQVELFDGNEDIQTYYRPKNKDTNLNTSAVFPHDKNYLRFYFSTTSQTKPSKNIFKYRLLGIEENWQYSKDANNILYSALQPGTFTFEVLAANNDGIWSTSPASFNFKINSPWYQTFWAYLCYTIIGILSGYFILHYRNKRNIERLEASRLQELDEFKSRFYSNVTHEFRTPLTVINGMADELEKSADLNSSEKIARIKKNSHQLLKLINQLLEITKLKTGKSNLHFVQGNIIKQLSMMVSSLESLAKLRNISLQFYSEEKELLMDFDTSTIDKIVNNLLANALKFTEPYGKILLTCRSIIKHERPYLEIKVIDSGIGIEENRLPFIFDRFVQYESSTLQQGSGIGLSIVKEVVEMLEGELHVESKPKEGSTFFVRLPKTNVAPFKKVGTHRKAIKQEGSFGVHSDLDGSPILFIVEDNMDIQHYLKEILESRFIIHTFSNGQEALQGAFEIIPDIIISDVMMPYMDGNKFCALLKNDERTNHIPFIMLTAKAEQTHKVEGLKKGADAYLIKPFDKEELFVRINALLEIRKLLQKKYTDPDQNSLSAPADPFLNKIIEIIHKKMEDENYSIDQLAIDIHLSKSQLYRKLKALTGLSTALFVRKIKIEEAKKLLKSTHLNISEVAYRTGFKTPVYFSQIFKESVGKSPSEYRL